MATCAEAQDASAMRVVMELNDFMVIMMFLLLKMEVNAVVRI